MSEWERAEKKLWAKQMDCDKQSLCKLLYITAQYFLQIVLYKLKI